jgi:uncharacterized protein (TIGR02444 family)
VPGDNPLWSFSLRVYDDPAVRGALLALQDRCGADVNLLLWAAWAALQRRHALTPAEAAAGRAAAAPWQAGVVAPLRQARRVLKPAAAADPQAAALRARLQALELDAERIAQDRLAALPLAPGAAPPPTADTDSLAGNLAAVAGAKADPALLAALAHALAGQ